MPKSARIGDQDMLRLEAFTGRTWDASTMLGEVGQGCWVSDHGGRKNLIQPVMEAAIYIHPGVNTGGHIVLTLRNCKLRSWGTRR